MLNTSLFPYNKFSQSEILYNRMILEIIREKNMNLTVCIFLLRDLTCYINLLDLFGVYLIGVFSYNKVTTFFYCDCSIRTELRDYVKSLVVEVKKII